MESNRILYRRFHESDFDALYEILKNDNVTRYLPDRTGISEERCKQWLDYFVKSYDETKPKLIYALIDKESSKLFGYAGVAYLKEFKLNEIMYGIHEALWKQGLATEAAKKMKELAIEFKLKKVVALFDPQNIRTNKILIRLCYILNDIVNPWGMDLNYFKTEI